MEPRPCDCDGCAPVPPARPGRCLAFWGSLDRGWAVLDLLDPRVLLRDDPRSLAARGANDPVPGYPRRP